VKNNEAIGLFDSGIGGTSIWKEVVQLMPHEHTMYIADSAYAPYGHKTKEQIIERCVKNTEFLLDKGCKIVIVACNTATTNAIEYLRLHYDIPFIGIEPAIKPAAMLSKSGAVGILATRGTLSSQLFEKTSADHARHVKTIEQEGEGIVALIENGKIESDEMTALLNAYLQPMLKHNIDHLVLGCTHYPYLIPQIEKIVGPQVTIIDSGRAVAKQTLAVLRKHGLLRIQKGETRHNFYSNTDMKSLKSLLGPLDENMAFMKF
jgi:glutamate racemase